MTWPPTCARTRSPQPGLGDATPGGRSRTSGGWRVDLGLRPVQLPERRCVVRIVGRKEEALAAETRGRPVSAYVVVAAPVAQRARDAGRWREWTGSEGRVFHSARWDHGLRSDRQAGGGRRDRRVRDPVRIRRSSPGRRGCRCSSARRLGDAAGGARISPRRGGCTAARRAGSAPLRSAIYWFRELNLLAFTGRCGRVSAGGEAGPATWPAGADPVLRARLTPATDRMQAHPAQRRLLPGAGGPNVELVTSPVVEVRPHSVVDADGREHRSTP